MSTAHMSTASLGSGYAVGESAKAENIWFDSNSTLNTSAVITVNLQPYWVEAYNLGPDDRILIEIVNGEGSGAFFARYCPVYGPIILDENLTKYRIEADGRYRLRYIGEGEVGTFRVVGFPGTMTQENTGDLATALRTAIAGVSITGTDPIVVAGLGTIASPYVISANQASNAQQIAGIPHQYLINNFGLNYYINSDPTPGNESTRVGVGSFSYPGSTVMGVGAKSANLSIADANATLYGTRCGQGLPSLTGFVPTISQVQGCAYGWHSAAGVKGLSAGYETFDRNNYGVTLGDRAGVGGNFIDSGLPYGGIKAGSGAGLAHGGDRAINIGYYTGVYGEDDDSINIGTRAGSKPPVGATQIGATLPNTVINNDGSTIVSITVTGHGVPLATTISALILAEQDATHRNSRGPLFEQTAITPVSVSPIVVRLTASDANTLTFDGITENYIPTDSEYQFTLWDVTGITLSYANTICIGTDTLATQANQIILGNATATQLVTAGSVISGGVIGPSDERLKKKVETFNGGLDIVRKIRAVTHEWNEHALRQANIPYLQSDLNKAHYSVIAHELEKILPDHIELVNNGFGDYKFVRYDRTIPILYSAINNLDEDNQELRKELHELRKELEKLKKSSHSTKKTTED